MLDNTKDVFQEPSVVTVVEHSSEDPGGGTIIAKQVIRHKLFWSKHFLVILGSRKCEVTSTNRKFCKLCRYDKCLAVGMRPELVDVNTKKEEQEEGLEKMIGDEVNIMESRTQDSPRFDLLDLTRESDLSKPSPFLSMSMNESIVFPSEVTNSEDIEKIDNQRTIKEYKELETMVNTCRTVSVISYCSQKSEQEQSDPINQTFDDVLELSKDFEFENNDILLQPSVNCPGSVDSVMVGSESEEPDNNINFDSREVIPFKKRERVKDWLPYCHTLSMQVSDQIKNL